MKQPPVITYNLKERGREHRGKERHFNIPEIRRSILSPATQERIKTRAMLGYFGHKPRILAQNLEPTESLVVNGKYTEIEPAIVTVSLDMTSDGTITHQTEFLDTASGRKASKMFESRIGGFSSAIDERAPEFFGFDYVLDPNYSTNRGFSLDSVGMTLDEVMDASISEEEAFLNALINSKDDQIKQLSLSLDSAQVENEQYLSMVASGNQNLAVDDSYIAPYSVTLDSTSQFEADISAFREQANLPLIKEEATTISRADIALNKEYDKLINQMRSRL